MGVWNVSDVYFRFSATGQYSVGEHITRFVVGEPEAHIVIEGDLIKLYNEAGCATTDVGVYRISFAPDGSRYT